MQPSNNISPSVARTSAKDFFLNLGAIVALYTTVISLLNLLFTVINTAFPKITNAYQYFGSTSISWPVSILIIFFPIFILLMWLLEKVYRVEPEKRNLPVKRWLTYITLFVAGLVLAGDLVTVLYYFIDGQELNTGFLLKVLAVLIVTSLVFVYYISDVRGKLNSSSQRMWSIIAGVLVIVSIVWGFSVLGSPHTQRLYKYDTQKMNDLVNMDSAIRNYYYQNKKLPANLSELSATNYYYYNSTDPQSGKAYEYQKVSDTKFSICAEFNNSSDSQSNSIARAYGEWIHQAGRQCFERSITLDQTGKPLPL